MLKGWMDAVRFDGVDFSGFTPVRDAEELALNP
jgi:hypothetical protein